eukprot:COSAG05_NODE_18143_length_313_cov_0.719626_1_plen_45_part_10
MRHSVRESQAIEVPVLEIGDSLGGGGGDQQLRPAADDVLEADLGK